MTETTAPQDSDARRSRSDPRVSVVIPLYNHEQYIERAVESVLAQSTSAAELIVIDDGSGDGSAETMRRICVRHPDIVFWSWPNQGAHHTLNSAILRATGDFVAILNSDDCYHPGRIAACLEVVRADPSVDMVATAVRFTDTDGRYVENAWYEDTVRFHRQQRDFSLSLFHGNFLVSTSNYFIRRSVFDRLGYFAPLRYAHDLEFALRLVAAKCNVHFLDSPLLEYRSHGANTIGQDVARQDIERAAIYALFLHQRWVRGDMDAPALQRHAGQLEQQRLLDIVEQFLALLARGPKERDDAVADPIALAFLEYQRQLGIDWRSRDSRDPLLAQLAETHDRRRRQDEAWDRAAAGYEAQVRSLNSALEETVRAKDWLAGQRDAWERVAREHEGRLRALIDDLRQLTEAKDWLAGQRDAWERVVHDHDAQFASLSRYVAELTEAKDWLAGQRDAWAAEATVCAQTIAGQNRELAELDRRLSECRVRFDQLRDSLHSLLGSRRLALLVRAGLLRLPESLAEFTGERNRS